MAYKESQQDKELRKRFQNDNSVQQLRSVELKTGEIRGISNCKVIFDFPITAIAGKNGSGKSTILALSCCAFHNDKDGFTPLNRKISYYTFVDFFVQHQDEVSPEGINIRYGITHNNRRFTKNNPDKEKVRYQVRKKKKGGKWNDYSSRVKRDVVFLGIERIVPHNEKSQSRSYKKSFSQDAVKGWEKNVREMVGKVVGKQYDDFKYATHSKYRLPIISSNGKTYSGFNMGAGENALFEVFSILYAVPVGSLIVIDELELGLHAEAQTKFVKALKEVCLKRKLQIICTTHSKEIFEQLPNDARVFIEHTGSKTDVIIGVSPDYAFSKMSASNFSELRILVEDDIAKKILESMILDNLRTRINIEVIGSASSLARQLGVNYQRKSNEKIIVVFDGDQRDKEHDNCKTAHAISEESNKDKFNKWFQKRIAYLPENESPEQWLIKQVVTYNVESAASLLKVETDKLRSILQEVLQEDPHSMLFHIAEKINIPKESILTYFCAAINLSGDDHFDDLEEQIQEFLDN